MNDVSLECHIEKIALLKSLPPINMGYAKKQFSAILHSLYGYFNSSLLSNSESVQNQFSADCKIFYDFENSTTIVFRNHNQMINQKPATILSNRLLVTTIITIAFICGISLHFCTRAATSSAPDAITPDGGQYHGQLVDGKLQGHGKLEWANGAHYEGDFDKGLMSGKGKYKSSTGTTYEGDYKNGMLDGEGRLVEPDGAIYIGHFTNNEFNGQGRYQTSKGYVYVGQFLNGLYDGQGKWTDDGEEYAGEFKK
ncbi:MAG: MORN repeat-containing protein, partial [Burkholderiaceae bacterium]